MEENTINFSNSGNQPDELTLFLGNLTPDIPIGLLKQNIVEMFRNLGLPIVKQAVKIINGKYSMFAFVALKHLGEREYFFSTWDSLTDDAYQRIIQNVVENGRALKVDIKRPRYVPAPQQSKQSKDSQNYGIRADDRPINSTSQLNALTGPWYLYGQNLGNETRTMEFKEAQGAYIRMQLKKDVSHYVCAFLNRAGGKLMLGVNDEGQVVGLTLNHKEEDQLRLDIDTVIKGFQPPVLPDMYTVSVIPVLTQQGAPTGLKVVDISVGSGNGTHLYETLKHEVYIRRDGSIQGPLKPSQIQEWTRVKLRDEQRQQDKELHNMEEKDRLMKEELKKLRGELAAAKQQKPSKMCVIS